MIRLPIHENPFGIYGETNGVCEVYLTECYFKINRPGEALKHFTRGIAEIARVKQTMPAVHCEYNQILEILDCEKFAPNQLIAQNDEVMQALAQVEPSKWAIECLLLGARLVPNSQVAISILKVALKCEPNSQLFSYILTELLSRVTSLVEQAVVFENGKVSLLPEAHTLIDRLDQLLAISSE